MALSYPLVAAALVVVLSFTYQARERPLVSRKRTLISPNFCLWKGTIPGGQVYRHPLVTLDVAATAVALSGLPNDPTLGGVNLLPFLSGENTGPPHDALMWRWISQSAIREGKWKLLRGGLREYLFDLEADKEERHNQLAEHPEIANRLRARLEAWGDELNPPGLSTGKMTATWEQYFDYYLDGKPAPPLRTKAER